MTRPARCGQKSGSVAGVRFTCPQEETGAAPNEDEASCHRMLDARVPV